MYSESLKEWTRLQRQVKDVVGQARIEVVWMNPAMVAGGQQLTLAL